MRLAQINEFLAVVDAGSIRAAARQRGQSQPGITKSIRALERELGVSLIRRSAHGVELTSSGQLFLTRARIVSQELERSRQELAHVGINRTVAIGSTPGAATVLLPRVLARLRRDAPDIEVQILEAMPQESLPRLRDGSFDFVLGPLLQPVAADLTISPLLNVEISIVSRRGHPLAKARSLSSLVNQDWVTAGFGRDTLIVDEMFRGAGLLPPRWAVRCGSVPALIAIVSRTDFIATIPKPLVEIGLTKDLLEVIRVREQLGMSKVCLFSKEGIPLTKAAAYLAKLIKDEARHVASRRSSRASSP